MLVGTAATAIAAAAAAAIVRCHHALDLRGAHLLDEALEVFRARRTLLGRVGACLLVGEQLLAARTPTNISPASPPANRVKNQRSEKKKTQKKIVLIFLVGNE